MSFCNSGSIKSYSIKSSNNNDNDNDNNYSYNNSNSSFCKSNNSNNSNRNMMLEGDDDDDDDGQLEGFCQPCPLDVVGPALQGTIDEVEVGAMEPKLAALHRILDERIRQRVRQRHIHRFLCRFVFFFPSHMQIKSIQEDMKRLTL
jgi:hypothetical protein